MPVCSFLQDNAIWQELVAIRDRGVANSGIWCDDRQILLVDAMFAVLVGASGDGQEVGAAVSGNDSPSKGPLT
jgi:hypothetical protein